MKIILENSLLMAGLAVLVLIPVYFVKRGHQKQKQDALKKVLDEITGKHHADIMHKDILGQLLIAQLDNRKLLLMNMIDYSYQIMSLKEVVDIEQRTISNSKEVKSIDLLLKKENRQAQAINFYTQYRDSESHLSVAEKKAVEWQNLLKNML